MMTSRGGRNLLILGISSIVITVVTTTISLTIYYLSGDIYLDRSRPGYLPDEEEVIENTTETNNYSFSDSGPLDYDTITEYLKELKKVNGRLDGFPDAFSPSPLSNESLGIPSEFIE